MTEEERFAEYLKDMLREIRETAGYSQQQIADYLQIARSTYSYYELGKTAPSFFVIYKLCRFYKISPEVFFPEHRLKNRKSPQT